jgi:hypothetical protein
MTAIRLGSDGFDCHLAEAAETVRMAEREGATSNSPRGSAAMGSDTSSSLSRVRVSAETGSQTSSALALCVFRPPWNSLLVSIQQYGTKQCWRTGQN